MSSPVIAECNKGHAATRQVIKTDAGDVTLITCMRCDRIRCTQCQSPIADGKARHCARCGRTVAEFKP